MNNKVSLIIILTEGIRGHLHQSRGLAQWLSKDTGAMLKEITIPKLTGISRFKYLKMYGRKIPSMSKAGLGEWIIGAKGAPILEEIRKTLFNSALSPENCLVISAGSNPARYNLAIGRLLGMRTCTLMTPSLMGTESFSFAIVPKHDAPAVKDNLLETLGAPNSINRDKLKEEARLLSLKYPPGKALEKWALLIGGDDANYRVGPEWAKSRVNKIMELAVNKGAELYITTSRRTPRETEELLVELTSNCINVKMLLLASESDFNPVPGMLGLCSEVFCTEDSVSMLSESATAGHVVLLLRTDRKRGVRNILQKITMYLSEKGVISRSFLWGVPRFDAMIEDFKEKELILELQESISDWDMGAASVLSSTPEFNEAKRAAEWILKEWD